MKRLFLFSAMVLSCALCLAQNKTSYAGIYYYDSSSYGVMDRDSADYYRVVENNNTFNDYYAKDNALRASGALSYADPSDDSKTVFEGAFIAYYPSGKVWIKQFFKGGINDGEYTEYFENGLMKQHEFYKMGVLDGVKTVFEEDGKTCKQWEYKDGELVNDYYTESGGGYSVDYNSTTKEPIWRDVTTSDLNVIKDKKGNTIQAYAINGLYVSLDVAYRHYFGKYYVLQLYIQNNSPEDAYFTFDDVSIDSPNGKIKFFSKSDFERRMSSRQGWAQFGLQAASFATAITLEALTDEAFYRQNRRHHRTFGRDLAHDMSAFLIRQSAVVGSVLVSGLFNEENMKVRNENIGYLRNYQIKPHSSITGFAYAKYSPSAKMIMVNLPINGKIYQFPVDVTHLKNIDN
ncbi:MAG: hypothetical protein IK103_07555 [Bacteroidales bacterium]|nr:hypothetical protein [Bacteroidales bacterium]